MDAGQVDFELLQDVMTELQDHLPLLEDDMQQLVRFRESPELIASAFRHVHTIKGDFTFCGATPIADFVHQLENVLQSLRERRFLCTPLVCEAILQSLDRVRNMATALRNTRQFDDTPLTGLLASIDELAQASSQAAADQAARHVLLAAHNPGELLQGTSRWAPAAPTASTAASHDASAALQLGRQLADALAQRLPRWQGRAEKQLELVQSLNRQYPQPQNEQQLSLAVLWHDVGLLALPDAMLSAPPGPKDAAWAAWTQHPETAAQWLLSADKQCEEAAVIIRQHHQWADGRGFPTRTMPLHPAAQMLACADLFYEGVAGLSGEDYRRGALRAVFDVHGGLDTRFDALLINAFQAVAQQWTQQPAH